MNFPISRSRLTESAAFTLIELLVVITIIAVLAGLLLPVVNRVQENAKKVSTKSTEMQIIAAVNAYQTEYGQFPTPTTSNSSGSSSSGTTPADTTYGVDKTTNHNGLLFNVLRAINQESPLVYNTRRIVYFESKNVKNATNPRDGFIATGSPQGNPNASPVVTMQVGDLVDPWGNMYCVRIDSGYSNVVMNPYNDPSVTADDTVEEPSAAADPRNQDVLRTGVISWTWGNDGIAGSKGNTTFAAPYSPTPGDDVDSWQ